MNTTTPQLKRYRVCADFKDPKGKLLFHKTPLWEGGAANAREAIVQADGALRELILQDLRVDSVAVHCTSRDGETLALTEYAEDYRIGAGASALEHSGLAHDGVAEVSLTDEQRVAAEEFWRQRLGASAKDVIGEEAVKEAIAQSGADGEAVATGETFPGGQSRVSARNDGSRGGDNGGLAGAEAAGGRTSAADGAMEGRGASTVTPPVTEAPADPTFQGAGDRRDDEDGAPGIARGGWIPGGLREPLGERQVDQGGRAGDQHSQHRGTDCASPGLSANERSAVGGVVDADGFPAGRLDHVDGGRGHAPLAGSAAGVGGAADAVDFRPAPADQAQARRRGHLPLSERKGGTVAGGGGATANWRNPLGAGRLNIGRGFLVAKPCAWDFQGPIPADDIDNTMKLIEKQRRQFNRYYTGDFS